MTISDPTSLERLSLVPATPDDRYFDYCLEPYRPRRSPEGKVRSENLLWQSLKGAGALNGLEAPLRAVKAHVGTDLTVWGTKWDGHRTWWELYFYDPQKQSVEATVSSLREALAPFFRIVPSVPETVPYMMASFDLGPTTIATRAVTELNLYLTGEKAHAGRSYKVRADGIELENTYRFMEPKRHVDELLPLLQSSVFVDYSDPRRLSKVLIPELFACKKVCISKKRTCDAIYYSGIDVEQLVWFLRKFGHPSAVQRFVQQNAAKLDHLYFDVGIDYRQAADGSIDYPKTSYYGTI